MTVQEKIKQGKTYLGIEFGSTRIKAVLTDDTFVPIAAGRNGRTATKTECGRTPLRI